MPRNSKKPAGRVHSAPVQPVDPKERERAVTAIDEPKRRMSPGAYELPEGMNLDWPDVAFDVSGEGGFAHPLQPDYFDSLRRIFVLLHNDTPLGRALHAVVQAHFGTGMSCPSPAERPEGGVSQADLRALLALDMAVELLSRRAAALLLAGETSEPGGLTVQHECENRRLPDMNRLFGFSNRYVSLNVTDVARAGVDTLA